MSGTGMTVTVTYEIPVKDQPDVFQLLDVDGDENGMLELIMNSDWRCKMRMYT